MKKNKIWSDLRGYGMRNDTVTWLAKAGIQTQEEIKNLDKKDVFKLSGIGISRGSDILQFLDKLHINPIEYFNKKLEDNGWYFFRVTAETHIMQYMLLLKINPDALEVFEKKYQIKIGASFTEKTGILGMTPYHAIESKFEADNIWQVWSGRIIYIYNTIMDDLQRQQQNALVANTH